MSVSDIDFVYDSIKEGKAMKKYFINLLLILILLIAGVFFMSLFFDDIDACLDGGGCWDYIRHRCEMEDQGYCERNEQDCLNRNGIWQEDKKYCVLKDK